MRTWPPSRPTIPASGASSPVSLRAILTKMASRRHVARAMPDGYRNLFDLIVKEGEAFEPRSLPSGYRASPSEDCGVNAARDAFGDRSLTYVEGFALGGSLYPRIPILHAWCIDVAGGVVERTWLYDAEIEYLGLRIATDTLEGWRREAGAPLSILWPHSDPLGAHPLEAFDATAIVGDNWPEPRDRWPELVANHRALRKDLSLVA
jgi:hypothetical protein